jgi:alpha-tubulin suppressor-like RCC1 family protein/Mg-chelatase subunit ChlD
MATRLGRRLIATALGALLLVPAMGAQPVLATFGCTNVHVVWARGAMLGPNALDFTGFYTNGLQPRILNPITQSAYQLGDTGYGGYLYQPVQDWTQLLGAGFGGNAGYDSSVASGHDELVHYLTDRAAGCPNETYVLGGFSEGSQVTGEALFDLPQNVRDRVAFVALFGDPKLDAGNWPPPTDPFTVACNGDKQPWHRGSAPCYIAGGVFGPRVPYLPTDIEQRVGSWCRQGDGACTSDPLDVLAVANPLGDGGEHMNYFDDNADAAFAARETAFRLKTYFASQATAFDASYDQFVSGQAGADLAIVFDTTGSMSGAIANAKSQATELAQQWTTLFENGRVGLVDFKDQGDPYVARVDLGLTSDANAFQTAVNALSASGGGDTPEAQLSGLMTALDGLSWANGATKAAVVITDAPGKDPEPITNYTRTSVSQHALEIDPVAIYGVDVANDSTVSGWMAPLASATAGEVVTLQSGQSLSDALSGLFDSVHANPIAKLDSPVIARTGTPANFDASNSFDASSTIASYEWDFDGNGTVDRTTATATTSYTYPSTFHGTASVRVVANDGRSAIATGDVTIDTVGLASSQPIAPTSAGATATGPSQVTVTWTPAASDRAEGYKVLAADNTVLAIRVASDPHQVVIDDVNLSQPIHLYVVASNAYGDSASVQTPSVGGQIGSGRAWGDNSQGQLGNGTTSGSSTPINVANLTSITAIATGAEHSLAVKSGGTVWAWGQNANGEVGDGSLTDRLSPVQITSLSGVTAVAAGTAHSLFLKSDGTVWAAGLNQNGQLGDGTTTQRTTPVRVSGLTGVIAIAAGSDHSLALKSDGTVWAWGKNTSGQLGDGSKQKRTTPVRSGTLTGVTAIAAGGDHSLAVLSAGTVRAWGDNFYGQDGDGTTTLRTSPVAVLTLTGVVSVAAGSTHSLARKSDGTVWAWGNNGTGQLGDGTTTDRHSPVRSGTITGVTRIAAGAHHGFAIKTDGTLWAWGYNLFGQLGDGTTTTRTTAVQVTGVPAIALVSGGAFFSLAATP